MRNKFVYVRRIASTGGLQFEQLPYNRIEKAVPVELTEEQKKDPRRPAGWNLVRMPNRRERRQAKSMARRMNKLRTTVSTGVPVNRHKLRAGARL